MKDSKNPQEEQGWDIVLGNPPYISAPNQLQDSKLSTQRETLKECGAYKTLHKKWDLYIPFIELGIAHLCKDNGICAFIIPYPFTNQPYAQKSREMIVNEYCLSELVDLQDTKVFQAEVLNCIIFMSKKPQKNIVALSRINETQSIKRAYSKSIDELIQDCKTYVWNTSNQQRDLNRYAHLNTLGDFCYISVGMGLHSSEHNTQYKFKKSDLISQTQDEIHCRAYIEGKDIDKYAIKQIKYLEYGTERCPNQCRGPRFKELFEVDKIITNKIGSLKATLDCNHTLCDQTIRVIVLWNDLKHITNKSITLSITKFSHFDRTTLESLSQGINLKYLLGILNSKYAKVLLQEIRGKGNIDLNPEYLRKLPIPKITDSNQHLAENIIRFVEEILESKTKDSKADITHLQSQIDSLVYALYELDSKEIAIIESLKEGK